jgi:hypothetical protein
MEDSSTPRLDDSVERPVRRRTARRGGDPLERVAISGERGRGLPDSARGRNRSTDAPEQILPPERDPLGKMALFSGEEERRSLGTFVLECSSCKRETPVSGAGLVRAALPFSLHLPLVRRFSSYMRCPACGRRTWLRLTWRS